jgi:hypothetical protein
MDDAAQSIEVEEIHEIIKKERQGNATRLSRRANSPLVRMVKNRSSVVEL